MGKRRFRSGTRALRAIKRLQKSTNRLIPQRPFVRLVREMIQSWSTTSDMRVTKSALEALQEGSEAYLVDLFATAVLAMVHTKRVTLAPRDIRLVNTITRCSWCTADSGAPTKAKPPVTHPTPPPSRVQRINPPKRRMPSHKKTLLNMINYLQKSDIDNVFSEQPYARTHGTRRTHRDPDAPTGEISTNMLDFYIHLLAYKQEQHKKHVLVLDTAHIAAVLATDPTATGFDTNTLRTAHAKCIADNCLLIERYDVVVIPFYIKTQAHWAVAMLFNDDTQYTNGADTAQIYNSLKNWSRQQSETLEQAVNSLDMLSKQCPYFSKAVWENVRDIPMQTDNISCGIYVFYYVENVLANNGMFKKNWKFNTRGNFDLHLYRQHVYNEIVNFYGANSVDLPS